MKGHIKIVIEERSETGRFPITETFTFERDNTFETIEDWLDIFKKLLLVKGFVIDGEIGLVDES